MVMNWILLCAYVVYKFFHCEPFQTINMNYTQLTPALSLALARTFTSTTSSSSSSSTLLYVTNWFNRRLSISFRFFFSAGNSDWFYFSLSFLHIEIWARLVAATAATATVLKTFKKEPMKCIYYINMCALHIWQKID